ncbi:unnamed protein product [Brassica oleracea var. botrytis]
MAVLDQIKKEWRGSRRYVFLSVFFKQRMMITISIERYISTEKPPYLCSHSNVCLSVFAVLARLLHENLLWSCDEPKVVVATNINPKAVIHDAISATNFYFGMSMMLGKVFLSENFS